MKRPPDRKFMLAATILIVAAGLMLARPAVGTDQVPAPSSSIAKLFGRS
jgi:hypothetical protein